MTLDDIALTNLPQINHYAQCHLIECFGDAKAIFAATLDELIEVAQLSPTAAKQLIKDAPQALEFAEQEMERCHKSRIIPIAASDPDYPSLMFEDCCDRPHVIYAVGNLEPLTRSIIAMVGTRNSSSYGERLCAMLIGDMVGAQDDIAITTGLAYGIDSAVHRSAIDRHIPTIAVVPTSLPQLSPAAQASLARKVVGNGGLVVSERHSQMQINPKELYRARNRIIAAMAAATVVVESPEKGGSMMTATLADNYNRPIFALPGRVTDPKSAGCNRLIYNKKAKLITSATELFKELEWEIKPAAAATPATKNKQPNEKLAQLTPQERQMIYHFVEEEPLSVAQLVEITGLEIRTVDNLLFSLEMNGMLKLLPGNRYERLIPL